MTQQEFGVFPGSWEWHLELKVQPQPTSAHPWMSGRCPSQERATNAGIPPQPFLRDPRSCKTTRGNGNFSRNAAWRGHLQKAPQESVTSCSCRAPSELHGTTGGAGCSCPAHLGAQAAGKQLQTAGSGEKCHPGALQGLEVQNANKTPNGSACSSSQTKHGCSFPSTHSQGQSSSTWASPSSIRVVLP